jgi:hypothetical protein
LNYEGPPPVRCAPQFFCFQGAGHVAYWSKADIGAYVLESAFGGKADIAN